jgi:hypothetical protein
MHSIGWPLKEIWSQTNQFKYYPLNEVSLEQHCKELSSCGITGLPERSRCIYEVSLESYILVNDFFFCRSFWLLSHVHVLRSNMYMGYFWKGNLTGRRIDNTILAYFYVRSQRFSSQKKLWIIVYHVQLSFTPCVLSLEYRRLATVYWLLPSNFFTNRILNVP